MSVNVGTIEGVLKLKDDFTGVLGKAGMSVAAAGKKAEQVGQKMSNVGGQLSRSITLPIVTLGGAVTTFATEWQSSFAGVEKTVDATEPELAELAATLRTLSTEIPVNVNELNAIAEAAGQLGIKTENIASFTETMAQLGIATNLSAEEAAASLARLANITGLPQTEFDRLGATIVDLGNNFATTEREIVDFGLRIAGAGEIAGLAEAEILAIATAMASVGVQSEAGGTSVQKVLLRMNEAVRTSNDDLILFAQTAGMSAQMFANSFRDNAAGAFESFVSGLGMQGDAAVGTLIALDLKNERVIRSFLSLAGAGDLLSEAIKRANAAFEDNTALIKEVEIRYKTFHSQMTVAWNRLKDVAITLGLALIPVFEDALDILIPWIAKLAELANWFSDLPKGIKGLIVSIAGLVAAIGPVLVVVGSLIAAWGAIATALPAIGTALAAVGGVFASVLGVLTSWPVILGAIALSIKPVRDFLFDLGKNILTKLRSMLATVIDKFSDWWAAAKKIKEFLTALARVISDDVVAWLTKTVDKVKNFITQTGILEDDIRFLETAFNFWRDSIKSVFTWIGDLSTTVLDFVDGMGGLLNIIKLTNPELGSAIDQLRLWASEARLAQIDSIDLSVSTDSMGAAMERVFDKVKKAGDELDDFGDDASDAGDDVDTAVTDISNAVISFGSSMEDVIDVSGRATTAFNDNSDAVTSGTAAYNALKSTFDLTALSAEDFKIEQDKLTDAFDNLTVDQYEAAMGRLENRLNKTASVADVIATGFSDLTDTLLRDSSLITSAISGLFGDDIGNSLSDFADMFAQGFGTARDSGLGMVDSMKAGWDGLVTNLSGNFKGIVAGMQATSGESQAMMNGALSAVANFATGNYVGAFVSAAGVVVGLFADQRRSIEEIRASFRGFVGDIVDGNNVMKAAAGLVGDFWELAARDAGQAALELENSLGNLVDATIDDIMTLGMSLENHMDQWRQVASIGEIIKTAVREGVIATREIEIQLDKTRVKFFEVFAALQQVMKEQSTAMVDGLVTAFGDFSTLTTRELEFAEESVLQAFNTMIDAGVPLGDLVTKFGPMLDQVSARALELGTDVSAEFSRIGEVMDILSNENLQGVINKLSGIGEVATAAGNLHTLSAEQLDFFGDAARNAYNKLIAGGLTGAEALKALGPELQQLHDLQEMYGFEVDASTQKLLDEAVAQDIVAVKGLDANDILVLGFERVLEALNRLIFAMGGVPVMFEGWTESADEMREGVGGPLREIDSEIRDINKGLDDVNEGMGNLGNSGDRGQGKGGPKGGFARGTQGFMDFGPRTNVDLHGLEEVVTFSQGQSIANMVSRAIQESQTSPISAVDSQSDEILLNQLQEMQSANNILSMLLVSSQDTGDSLRSRTSRMRTERRGPN